MEHWQLTAARLLQAERTSMFDRISEVIGSQIAEQQDNGCLAYWYALLCAVTAERAQPLTCYPSLCLKMAPLAVLSGATLPLGMLQPCAVSAAYTHRLCNQLTSTYTGICTCSLY